LQRVDAAAQLLQLIRRAGMGSAGHADTKQGDEDARAQTAGQLLSSGNVRVSEPSLGPPPRSLLRRSSARRPDSNGQRFQVSVQLVHQRLPVGMFNPTMS
jgi:hypothetical protein